MATDRVNHTLEDAANLSSPQVVEGEQASGSNGLNGSNINEERPRFQATSMVIEWNGESISEVRNGTGHFEPVSMTFKLDDQGNIEIPSDVSLPEWITVKDQHRKLEPPLVYIFNHEIIKNHADRTGSAKDVENLQNTFNRLKCRVEVVENPKKIDVTETIKKLENTNFDHLSALVVIILSHGGGNEIIVACDDEKYHLDNDVLDPICKIRSLRGKPKILIVQACKGGLEADAKPEEYGHYLKCYSTSEGYKAYRDSVYGSIYIQVLCKIMDQDALRKDFREIIKDVNEKTVVESIRLQHKQVPSTEGILQPFCFGDYVD
ncbi:caspase-3 isoform X2 [Drosophila kikkawai]|uniref:Caspase-3 isoform X2 n=1 Tax=Drosophila kikkawai TaxID=30033 RepID=A0A6P4IVV2_DROKI|nr:caspase-3 isoform X2 [Drosophila kikkawai]